MVVDII